MFNRIATFPRSTPPYHYQQRVAPVMTLQPHAPVYVRLMRKDHQVECIACQCQHAEAIGQILWRAHVPDSCGVELQDYCVQIQQDRRSQRRRSA